MLTYLMSGLIEGLDSHIFYSIVLHVVSGKPLYSHKRVMVKKAVFGINIKLVLTEEPP